MTKQLSMGAPSGASWPGEKIFQEVHAHLEVMGIKVGTGTIVDATLISAPPSTKNKDKKRDPDMHQTKKG